MTRRRALTCRGGRVDHVLAPGSGRCSRCGRDFGDVYPRGRYDSLAPAGELGWKVLLVFGPGGRDMLESALRRDDAVEAINLLQHVLDGLVPVMASGAARGSARRGARR